MMARKNNPRFNPTNGHFVRNKPDEIRESTEKVPLPPRFKTRLSPFFWDEPLPSMETTYETSIPVYQSMPQNYRLFFDTGFITSHEIPQQLLESYCDKQIFITDQVWRELQPWVAEPWCNKWFRDYLVDAMKLELKGVGHPNVSMARIEDFSEGMSQVAKYYINLLWLRKYFAILKYEEFIEENGREPTLGEIQVICEKSAGSRGWRIAKKAIEERQSPRITTDESLVVTAVFHSILFGSPVVVLTRDNDVFDQFYKMIYLVDTHYMGMLMAEKYDASPSEFKVMPAPDGKDLLYEGEGNLLLSFSKDLHTLRPQNVQPIQCSCGLFSTSDKPLMYSGRTFGIAREMEAILRVKQQTRGRNTDLFGNLNFHIELDPRRVKFTMSGPALVNDKYLPKEAGEDFPISITDSELAVFTNEQFSQERFQWLAPGVLSEE